MTRLASWADFGTHDESAYPELWRGCVGAWAPCLGPTGLTLRDWSGRQNHGTLINMTPGDDWLVSGGRYALDFDGLNDHVSFSQNAPLLPGSFAISLWFRPNVLNTTQRYILSALSGGDNYYSVIWEYIDNTVEFYAGVNNPGQRFRTNTQISVTDTAWYHIVYNFNRSSFTAWRNGALQNTNTTAVSLNSPSNPSLWLATFQSGSNAGNIQLDDVRIYDRALAQQEIRTLATCRGIAYERRKRRQVFFDAAFFNPAWARNSNVIISPVGAA